MEVNTQNTASSVLENFSKYVDLTNLANELAQVLLDYTNGGDLENLELQKTTINSKAFKDLRHLSHELSRSSDIDQALKYAYTLIAAWKHFIYSEGNIQIHRFSPGLYRSVDDRISQMEMLSSKLIGAIPFHIDEFVKNERAKFEKMLSDLQEEVQSKSIGLTDKLSQAEKKINTLTKSYDAELGKSDLLFADANSKVRNHLKKIEEFMGVVTDRGLTNDFNKRAEDEGETANLFQGAAVAIMIAIGVYAIYLLNKTLEMEVSAGQAIIKALTLVILSAIPAYLAKESGRHRNYQYHFRQTALDIAALPSYLARVEDKEAEKILLEMAPKLFTRHAYLPGQSDNDFAFRDLLLRLLDKFPNKT